LAIKSDNRAVILAQYGKLDEVLEWCKQHCNGAWDLVVVREQAGYGAGIYEFEFDDDRDLIVFDLKWG
jgi:hypothetical protein